MDDAVLGLIWVTSVCIFGHIVLAAHFSKVIKNESTGIDNKINEIDAGLSAMAQFLFDKMENLGSQTGFDWGAIISQLLTGQNSPDNAYNRLPNGQFNGEAWEQEEGELITPKE